jgi:hypothetical protein
MMMVMMRAGMQLGETHALALSCCQQLLVPLRRKLLPEIVDGTKGFEYTHSGTFW